MRTIKNKVFRYNWLEQNDKIKYEDCSFHMCTFIVVTEKQFTKNCKDCYFSGGMFYEFKTKKNFELFKDINNNNQALLHMKHDNKYIRNKCKRILKYGTDKVDDRPSEIGEALGAQRSVRLQRRRL